MYRRGIDFCNSRLEDARLNGAKVSGCFFPKGLSADEINLSVTRGLRLQYGR
jgi:hypothetical protein